MTIDRLEQLDALPVGAEISDHGRVAKKSPKGGWFHSDGQRWEPGVPVWLVDVPGQ